MKQEALKIAIKILKPIEHLELRAYPDPASELYQELSKHNILRKFMDGKLELPDYLAKLSGAPWTLGYGMTKGVKQGDTITEERAVAALAELVEEYMQAVLKTSPKLATESPEKLAAVTSLAYNIGLNAYEKSTVKRCIDKEDWDGAADAFMMWVKAGGKTMQGLINRRQIEKNLFKSVRCKI